MILALPAYAKHRFSARRPQRRGWQDARTWSPPQRLAPSSWPSQVVRRQVAASTVKVRLLASCRRTGFWRLA